MSEQEGTITRQRRFAQLPDALIDDTTISPLAVRLWAKLDRYAGKDGRAFPSRARLAADLAVSVPTISRALSDLADAGWITRTARTGSIWDTVLNDAPGSPVIRPRITSDADPDHTRSGTRITSDAEKESQRRRAKERTSRRASALPSDWTPNRAHQEKATKRRLNLGFEAEQFKSHHEAKGSTFVSWDAAFHTWLGNAVKFGTGRTGSPRPAQGNTDHWQNNGDFGMPGTGGAA
jgi:DNA-binding FadR family transcriptional regulator